MQVRLFVSVVESHCSIQAFSHFGKNVRSKASWICLPVPNVWQEQYPAKLPGEIKVWQLLPVDFVEECRCVCANSVTKEEVGVQRLQSRLHSWCIYTWMFISSIYISLMSTHPFMWSEYTIGSGLFLASLETLISSCIVSTRALFVLFFFFSFLRNTCFLGNTAWWICLLNCHWSSFPLGFQPDHCKACLQVDLRYKYIFQSKLFHTFNLCFRYSHLCLRYWHDHVRVYVCIRMFRSSNCYVDFHMLRDLRTYKFKTTFDTEWLEVF